MQDEKISNQYRIFSFINLKGGVGKTSISANIAACYARNNLQKKVLIIDLDPQKNLTSLYYNLRDASFLTVADFLIGKKESPVKLRDNLFLLCGSIATADLPQKNTEKYIERVRALLNNYDVIVIDTPPSLDYPSLLSILFADAVLIIVKPDAFARNSLEIIKQTVKTMQEENKIKGIVINQYNPHTPKRHNVVITDLMRFEYPILTPYIRMSHIFDVSELDKQFAYEMPKIIVKRNYIDELDALANTIIGGPNHE